MSRTGSLPVNGALAAAGGFLDGFTYVGHDHVFANAMTGNVILFAANCFKGTWHTALQYLPPIAAFLAAVWAARSMHIVSKHRQIGRSPGEVLVLEIIVLAILACLPAGAPDVAFTSSIAFIATLQMQTFQEVNGRPYCSTFATGNLRTLGEAAFTWSFEGRAAEAARVVRDFSVIVTAFLLGAIGGGAAAKVLGNRALWWDIALLAAVAFYLHGSWRRTHRSGVANPNRDAASTAV